MNPVEKALNLWVELTGIDPNATKLKMKDWEIQSINDELKESLTLDNTYITTVMMLDVFAKEYLNQRTFSVNEMLADYDTVVEYLKKSKDLYNTLQSDDFVEQKEGYIEWVKKALEHYKIDNPKVYEMANDYESIAFLRRDALRSIENLELHQFFQGQPSSENAKYLKTVHEFWNVNSLIRSMMTTPELSGISLNLIRDPLATSSYFIFAIKNGETLSILTDKPRDAHPLQKYMARRPGRELSERIFKNHFPYDLLDIEFNHKGDAYHKPKDTKELVFYQPELYPLKEIKDLAPDEVIWIVMMFSLIEEKFWKKDYKTKELSYTGEMIHFQTSITKQSNDIVKQDSSLMTTLELPILTSEDISTDKMENEWKEKPTKKNKWLEERYEHLIPHNVLNLIGNGSNVKLLGDGNEITDISEEEYESATHFINGNPYKESRLQYVETSFFGNKEEIHQNQRWKARYNKALIINKEAKKEFEEKNEILKAEYMDRIKQNAENLLNSIAIGEFLAPTTERADHYFGDKEEYVIKNILRLYENDSDGYYLSRYNSKEPITLNKGLNESQQSLCYINGSKATLVAKFAPRTAEALALLCGCDIQELPELLQQWNLHDLYSGNELIRNIDPMEWVVKDPWKKLNLDVEFHLSKSGYNQLRKKAGFAPNRFWLENN